MRDGHQEQEGHRGSDGDWRGDQKYSIKEPTLHPYALVQGNLCKKDYN